jgi:putative FmdB family regulatory protein
MIYNYICTACDKSFEKNVPIADREEPTKKPCPACHKKGKVDRVFQYAPAISYDGGVSDIKRAGSGWNDVLKRIDKYAGKRSQVDHY